MSWKETYFLRKEPTKMQNVSMDLMSVFAFVTAFICSMSPVIAVFALLFAFK